MRSPSTAHVDAFSTAFAAHELRTPLAGLKTQAQVTLAADDPVVVRNALGQIVAAVDRSARLVCQLLTMARLDAEVGNPPRARVAVGPLLAEVVAGIGRSRAGWQARRHR